MTTIGPLANVGNCRQCEACFALPPVSSDACVRFAVSSEFATVADTELNSEFDTVSDAELVAP
jgi:hypothetical protein